jgi:hypothetical protein
MLHILMLPHRVHALHKHGVSIIRKPVVRNQWGMLHVMYLSCMHAPTVSVLTHNKRK